MEVTGNGEYPVIGASKVEVVLSGVWVQVGAETEVQFKTVVTSQVLLVGEFSTISCSATETAADVLCVGSKGQAQNCNHNKQ